MSGTLAGTSSVAWAFTWTELKSQRVTILDEVWLMKHFGWVEVLAAILLSLGVLSLYFMYDVRKKQA